MKRIDLNKLKFEIKIADFGLSKVLTSTTDLSNTMCGTPLYMAPQLVKQRKYSYKADIWSIGCILFELINGVTPFHARDLEEFEQKVAKCKMRLREIARDKLTLEAVLFMSNCL